jgi:heme iron utilization protein
VASRKIDPIRSTDDDARTLARRLISEARHGSLGVIDPESGFPWVSRIAVSADENGQVIFLASDLSFHAKALAIDRRASILLGEPGKGDVLAHPRITLIGEARKVGPKKRPKLRENWLLHHPKAEIYVDFADFEFYRLVLRRANLNAGFGKAYVLTPEDF